MIDDTDPAALSADDIAIDPNSLVLTVETDDDGGATVTFGQQQEPPAPETGFDDNLAEVLGESDLAVIAQDVLEGIEADDASRTPWLNDRKRAVDMLGIRQQRPDSNPTSVQGISTVTHPLLLEAVLRFQANARSELLPTDGPVKVRDDARQAPLGAAVAAQLGAQPTNDDMADALEADFNHYLTTIATEFVPTTDEMLFWVGLGGIEFKKVYHCPIKRRPVSDWVPADDLIVNNNASDIQSAPRVTHRIKMRPAILRRMQIAGAYRSIVLGPANDGDAVEATGSSGAMSEALGVSDSLSTREEDREHTILECYCELDLPGYEHAQDGLATGLPLPYKVTIDKDSQQILEIRRNWRETDDDDIPTARQVFVPFRFVPIDGFYAIGLLHILGNAANAATANWRMMLDAGMLENFPGGLIADTATRQDTLNLMAGLGEFRKVKVDGDIRQAVIPFPFKGPSAGLMQLQEDIVQTGSRIGGTAEVQVGEGRQDAPVGTTVALLEQAKIPLDAVHKRLHAAQAREFELLVDLFRDDPMAMVRGNKRQSAAWDEQMLIQALDDYDLVPMADPNTSSQLQRQMRYAMLVQLAQMSPPNFYLDKVITAVLRSAKIPNAESFVNPNPAPQGPQQDPAKMLAAQAQMANAQANQAKVQIAAQTSQRSTAANLQVAQLKSQDNARSLADQAQDRALKARMAALDYQKTMLQHDSKEQGTTARQVIGHVADHLAQQNAQAHETAMQGGDHVMQAGLAAHQGIASAIQQQRDHALALQQAAMGHQAGLHQQVVGHAADFAMQQQEHQAKLDQIKAQPKPKPGLAP